MVRTISGLVGLFLLCAGGLWVTAPAYAAADEVLVNVPVLAPRSEGSGSVANATSAPDYVRTIPALAKVVDANVSWYPLSKMGDMDGWLLVKDGWMQSLYIGARRDMVLWGVLVDANGQNLTEKQVNQVAASTPAVAKTLQEMAVRMQAIRQGQMGGGAGTKPAQQPGAMAVATPAVTPKQEASSPTEGSLSLSGAVTEKNVSGEGNSLTELQANDAEKTSGISVGERLWKDITTAHTVLLGDPQAPVIYMIVDAECPHCKATWRDLRDSVKQGKVAVRLVPIGSLDSPSMMKGAVLLRSKDPYGVWDKNAGGDAQAFADKPDIAAAEEVRINSELVYRWQIEATPFTVYRSKDGVVKVIRGEIKESATVIADVGR